MTTIHPRSLLSSTFGVFSSSTTPSSPEHRLSLGQYRRWRVRKAQCGGRLVQPYAPRSAKCRFRKCYAGDAEGECGEGSGDALLMGELCPGWSLRGASNSSCAIILLSILECYLLKGTSYYYQLRYYCTCMFTTSKGVVLFERSHLT